MKGHERVFCHTVGWTMHCEVRVNKTTETTFVEPPDLDDFSFPKRIHESRFCVTDVLQFFHCSLKLTDDRSVINVYFTPSVLHLRQHPEQVVQDFVILKSLERVPKHIATQSCPKLSEYHDEWPSQSRSSSQAVRIGVQLHSWLPPWDCWQPHRDHRDRVSVLSPARFAWDGAAWRKRVWWWAQNARHKHKSHISKSRF